MRVRWYRYLSTPDMVKAPEQKASRGARTIISERTHVYACITIPSLQLATIFTLWRDRAKTRRERSSLPHHRPPSMLHPTLVGEVCALVRHPRWTYYLRSPILSMYRFVRRRILLLNSSIAEQFIFCVLYMLLTVTSRCFLINKFNFL